MIKIIVIEICGFEIPIAGLLGLVACFARSGDCAIKNCSRNTQSVVRRAAHHVAIIVAPRVATTSNGFGI